MPFGCGAFVDRNVHRHAYLPFIFPASGQRLPGCCGQCYGDARAVEITPIANAADSELPAAIEAGRADEEAEHRRVRAVRPAHFDRPPSHAPTGAGRRQRLQQRRHRRRSMTGAAHVGRGEIRVAAGEQRHRRQILSISGHKRGHDFAQCAVATIDDDMRDAAPREIGQHFGQMVDRARLSLDDLGAERQRRRSRRLEKTIALAVRVADHAEPDRRQARRGRGCGHFNIMCDMCRTERRQGRNYP